MNQYADERPRVALIELDEAQEASIAHLCGTLRSASSVPNYLEQYDWSETDITVLGDIWPPGEQVEGHLLAIGVRSLSWVATALPLNQPWTVSQNTNNTERELSIPDGCPERYRHLAASLAQRLRLGEGPPRTFSIRRTRHDSVLGTMTSDKRAEDDSVLGMTTSGRAVALRSVYKSTPIPGFESLARLAIALALPEEADLAAWFRAFLGDIHENDPARVPQPPPRVGDLAAWYTPEESTWAQRIEEIRGETVRLLNEHKQAETELAAASERADAGKRRCLWADGDDLVEAVGEILEELGFAVRYMDAETKPGELKREDLRLTIPDRDGWEAIAEVKGYSAGTRTNDARQIREHRDLYISEKGHAPNLTLWIANTYKSVEDPSSRPAPANDVGQRAALIEAVHVLAADLYRLSVLVQAGNLEQSQAVQHMIDSAPGLWSQLQLTPDQQTNAANMKQR